MALQPQIIAGQTTTPYTPEWYQQQDADAIRRYGVAGTAQGRGEANYLKEVSPSLSGLYAAMSGGGAVDGTGGTGNFSSVSYPTGGTNTPTNPTASIAPLDFKAANSAAFATAKDQAAQTAGASLQGLQQALAGRGMTGGGYEAGQIGQTLAREANTIGEAGRAEAVHEADLAARAGEANLSSQVAQRGQDIGQQESGAERAARAAEAAYSGGIAQRGQDISAAEEAANRAVDLAKFRSGQSLALLQSVLHGGAIDPTSPVYVY